MCCFMGYSVAFNGSLEWSNKLIVIVSKQIEGKKSKKEDAEEEEEQWKRRKKVKEEKERERRGGHTLDWRDFIAPN